MPNKVITLLADGLTALPITVKNFDIADIPEPAGFLTETSQRCMASYWNTGTDNPCQVIIAWVRNISSDIIAFTRKEKI